MNCKTIEELLGGIKVNARGSMRGKNKVIDKIHAAHLKSRDNELMDIRIFVAKMSTGHDTKTALKLIDDFLYQKSIK